MRLKNVKRYIVLSCWLVVNIFVVYSQTDPQMGQYMYMQAAYNPAAAGDGGLMRVAGMHRMQYTGMKDMPMSTYFTFSSPFKIAKTDHAVGVRFLNDMYGLFTNQTFHVQYAYRQKLGNGYLCVGTDLGFVNVQFDADKMNLDQIVDLESSGQTEEGYHQKPGQDTLLNNLSKSANGMTFDMGLGVYYASPTWWAGVSYSHLTQPKVRWGDRVGVKLRGTLYAAGGYNWRLKNRNWTLKPSLMLMTDFSSWDVNATMMAEVKQRYRFGVGYRIAGSVNVLLGVDIIDGLQLGYTYELPANRLIRATYGSHELYLAYGFNVLKPKQTNRYKSVRYL